MNKLLVCLVAVLGIVAYYGISGMWVHEDDNTLEDGRTIRKMYGGKSKPKKKKMDYVEKKNKAGAPKKCAYKIGDGGCDDPGAYRISGSTSSEATVEQATEKCNRLPGCATFCRRTRGRTYYFRDGCKLKSGNNGRVFYKLKECGGDFIRLTDKKCGRNLYTFTGASKCDGWSGLTESQCQDKCRKNELPAGCVGVVPEGTICGYAQIKDNQGHWCHLGSADCVVQAGKSYTLFKKKQPQAKTGWDDDL